MEVDLFSSRSIWTMIHGIVLGGGALMGLFAALFCLWAFRAPAPASSGSTWSTPSRYVAGLTVFTAVLLWLTVIIGTYVNFPPYRATPPEGVTDLAQYPRQLLLSNPGTAWLHGFAMEIKEHVPWISAMLATAGAFVAMRYPSGVLRDGTPRRVTATLLAICFVLVAVTSLLGVFINKVAPLD